MRHEFVEVLGSRIHYEVRGSGSTVVLIHAGVSDLRMWDDQVGPIGERYCVVRYDAWGWGRSDDPPAASTNHDDLGALLGHLGIARAMVVGCSGGARIALDFTLEQPEAVDKLVLASPALGGFPWSLAGFAAKAGAMRDALEQGDVEQAAEIWTQVWVDGPMRSAEQIDSTVRSRAHDMLLRSMRRRSTGDVERREIDPPAIERLAEVEAPTLVVVGQHDVPDIRSIAEVLADGIRDARLVAMEDVGHLLPMETPAAFNRLVLDFLQETMPSGS